MELNSFEKKGRDVEQSEDIKESALDYPPEDRGENERIGSALNGEACISFMWHGNEWLAGSTRGAAIYTWVTQYSVTNEPLQSPLRPTVDAAWLAKFIADANSRVSAIRDHRWEAAVRILIHLRSFTDLSVAMPADIALSRDNSYSRTRIDQGSLGNILRS